MESKMLRILKIVKMKWISMLNPSKKVITKYQFFFMKMDMDMNTHFQITTNFGHLVDFDVLLSLACIFFLLKTIHNLLKFSQGNDNFICDFVSVIKICQTQMCSLFVNLVTKFQVEMFHEYHALLECPPESITLE